MLLFPRQWKSRSSLDVLRCLEMFFGEEEEKGGSHWFFGSQSVSSHSNAWAIQLPINLAVNSLMAKRVFSDSESSSLISCTVRSACILPSLAVLVADKLFHRIVFFMMVLVKTEINLEHMMTSALLSAGLTILNLSRVPTPSSGPPVSTTEASLRLSTSHFMMLWKEVSRIG